VRKAGNQVRITVQLIDARTDTHLWSETYDRTLDDIFVIQDEISAEVVSGLKLQLLDGPPTAEEIDPDAYELYLQARQVVNEYHEEKYGEAEQKLNRVLEVEPEFVPAIWELTRLAGRKGADIADPTGLSGNEKVRELVALMADIAPDSSYANGWLAHLALYSEGDYQKAAHFYERAVAFDNDWNSYFQLGQGAKFLYRLGRFEEAAEISRFLLSRDPACSSCIDTMALAMRAVGRHLEAAERLETILDWYAPTPEFYWSLGVAWLIAGEAEKALNYFDQTGGDASKELGRLLALHSLGRHEEFEEEFARFYAIASKDDPESIARVYAWSGQNDAAFEWLDKMVELQGPGRAADVKTDLYAKLQSDPRWQKFLKEHGQADEDLSHIVFNPRLPAAVRSALEAGPATR
jgi:tetratricopeptide (TPR) repeat protein